MPKTPSFDQLAALTEDELFLRLGREVIGSAAVPQSLETLIQLGRDTYTKSAAAVALKICDGKVSKINLRQFQGTILTETLISMILDGGTFNLSHAAVLYIASLIAQQGSETFCSIYGLGQAPSK